MSESADDALAEVIRRKQAWAWEQGFMAGHTHGYQLAQFDPQWAETDEPVAPRNPFGDKQP
jgi:hypothetical protein